MIPINEGYVFFEGVSQILKLFILPYGAYFVGIYARNKYFPEKHSPDLKVLMIIGVPVCLIVVTPILIAAQSSMNEITYAYIMTIGVIMEHGMIVHETAIAKIIEKNNSKKLRLDTN